MLQRRLLHTAKACLNKPLAPFTSTKYPKLKRNPCYSKITDKDVEHLRTFLTSSDLIYEKDPESTAIAHLNTDWFNLYRGSSSLCVFPKTTKQVSQILEYCHERQIAVVPQGGNTGVSGGAVPVFDEVIINLSKMDKIRHFDPISGVAIVDCGVVLEQLDQFLEPKGYTVPLDLGAKGSCQLGGNVSTNAGGLRLMRYGSLHGNVLGLEVVLPDGTVLDNISTLRKDNTGYDLKQLFIGAEGTLGIITGVSLLTPKRPKAVNVALIALESFEAIQKAFVLAKDHLTEILSAFEFWDQDSVGVVKSQLMQKSKYPLEGKHAFYALIETQGSKREHDETKLLEYIQLLMEKDIALDGVMAQSSDQIKTLWAWREKIPEAISKSGVALTYDVSMDVPLLYKLVKDTKEYFSKKDMLGPGKVYSNLIGFGHVGDGNLHIMANLNKTDSDGLKLMDEFIFSWAMKNKGSITAEHGIGVAKVQYMHRARSATQLQLMRTIKRAIDPKGIMNPYKVLPE
ncbi:hypothetical protein BDF20DRAFT_898394 [Mycotypha africana]|uniref:uncharacterized protein n=1 Tax=Mycotypha africana TaxID=64632 RepID=UPI002300C17B|nr:uncharacterized protein BDF20DRAFT_898394 [Mycotypha africana]KAI8968015.1 hypothetical protein BDF20DRAFT_898394 [Mycotypha africana]